MGYDSRLYIVERFEYCEKAHAVEIAQFDMCVMGYDRGFHELFDTEIDYEICDYGEYTMTDYYGVVCKWAHVGTVIEWLSKEVRHNDYRRLKPLLGFLEGIDESQWGELQVVHFGC